MAKFNTEDYSRTKVATWLGSGEFQFAMDNAFTNILKGAHSAKSEADTANVFEREIYFLLRQQFGIDIDIQKEVSVSRVVHNFGSLARRTSGKGRMDAVINSLVIEYKHKSKLKTVKQKQAAITQVRDYLQALTEYDEVKHSGIHNRFGVGKNSVRLNPVGSVLMAMYGATIGKLGILQIAATTNQACCACIPYDGVWNKYLFYYLMARRKAFIKIGEGGAPPNISKEKIVNALIPLPPLAEPKRIVAKLEELLPLCERLK